MPIRVLVVEDHAETADLIARRLRAAGAFDVATTPAMGEALEQLDCGGFDCVLLDYRLPDTSGLEALRRVRLGHPDLPVVVITGAGSEAVAVEAMKLGATDYIVKEGSYVRKIPWWCGRRSGGVRSGRL